MSVRKSLPVLALRDVVVYPHMVIPLFVGRPMSIEALEQAMKSDKRVVLIAQKDGELEAPKKEDLYDVGSIATILQMLKLPDGTVKVLVEGQQRVSVQSLTISSSLISAKVKVLDEDERVTVKAKALRKSVLEEFEQYIKANKKVPSEVLTAVTAIEELPRLTDSIAAHLMLPLKDRQNLLATVKPIVRLEMLLTFLQSEIEVTKVERRIRGRVKTQMEKNQREYYLNEQMKAIQKELSTLEEGGSDLDVLAEKIEQSGMAAEVLKKAKSELSKLKMTAPMSAEAAVSRNYLDTLISVPWSQKSEINRSLKKAQSVLDHDHYGLDKIKERIVEYLAVQQRVEKLKGPILCFVGPPGVGKTSLGESIARATGREFVRVALGGVRDEAEIRGHRRTYIGALPGKIMQKMSKVGVKNPLFMLDEIDKISSDFRGDPAAALLEVLDPEQNHAFNDHYLEVDYDLSDAMFIATANTLDLPAALLDRMEIIRLPGYTEDEKVNIAIEHLLPKQLEQHGLKASELAFNEAALRDIVRYYTHEAGVRNLEREIAKVCRKVVKALLTAKSKRKISITPRNLETYLGVQQYTYGLANANNQVGQVNGLAWTEVGGELLQIEAVILPGKGKFHSTGMLGEVMQESIQAAVTAVRQYSKELGLDAEYFENRDVHIHVPEGATPKDGPSAGISMSTAVVSSMTGIPVRADVAMTGEITLRGEVLGISGLKEKLLAALRAGIKHVIIPEENRKDLKEIPKNVTDGLAVHCVRWVGQVWELALENPPKDLIKRAKRPVRTRKKA